MPKLSALTGLFCAIAGVLCPAHAAVFPKPRQIEAPEGRLRLHETVPILLPSVPSSDDLFLAGLLIAELSDRYGLALNTKMVPSLPAEGPFILLGSVANPLVRQFLNAEAPPAHSEGYTLQVTDRAVVAAGTDASGAFYGFQSLRQLIERGADGIAVRSATIRDWPLLPFRGIKLYLPGHDNIEFCRRFIRDFMALYKYNKLFIEMNAAMRFERHPELNAGWIDFGKDMKYTRRERSPGPGRQLQDSANADTADGEVLEKQEVSDLVAYARRFHIDVIPEIPSLTHSYYLLARHRELAEIPDAEWPDTYCPSEPRVYKLLFDVLDEYIDVMKPAMILIGHDEWRMPLGVCSRCKGKNSADLYAADVNRIHAYLRSKGVTTAMYGDHLIERLRGKKTRHVENSSGAPYDTPGGLSPEQVRELIPKDILIVNWFWDSRGNEDLDENGLGRRNETDLSEWGFRQVFGNFEARMPDFDRRTAVPGIIGAAPSSWAATNELNFGKDMMFDFLGSANLLWSTDRPDMAQLALMVQERLPEIRSRLSAEPLPSRDCPVVPVAMTAAEHVKIGADASSLIFHHSCKKHARNRAAWSATWNFADTAELLGWYDVEYMDGFVQTVPVRYGINVLESDWLQTAAPRSVAYQATIEPRGDGMSDFGFEWINPRLGISIREVRLHSISSENPITLSVLSMVPKRPAPEPKPLRLSP